MVKPRNIYEPKDYLEVEYSLKSHPLTAYPAKLADYLCSEFGLSPGDKLIEMGCGRCEVLAGFGSKGIVTYGIDSAPSSAIYAERASAKFELLHFSSSEKFDPFEGTKFDFVFSKSFIEHLENPQDFMRAAKKILKPGGKIITLTPDFEANVKVFYDDFTHIKPFTVKSISQLLEISGFEDIRVFKFRQLPITWIFPPARISSIITGWFVHPRAKNKWLRWSRELQIASCGTFPDESRIEKQK
jgi:SAM-dependent methyltransferase